MSKMKSTPEFKSAWNEAKAANNLDNDHDTVEVHGKSIVVAKSRDEAYAIAYRLWEKSRGISMNSLVNGGLSDAPNEITKDGDMDFNFHWEGDYQTMRDLYHDLKLMDSESIYFCRMTLSRIEEEFEDVSEMFE